MSDTHGLHRRVQVPDGDVLIHAGDFTNMGELDQVTDFNAWLGELPHAQKIVIAGNHDISFQRNPTSTEALLTNATYLRDSVIQVGKFKLYGSPWTPKFMSNSPWAFETVRSERPAIWAQIPEDVDILITHGPPSRVLDLTGKIYAGDEALAARLADLPNLKIHVFGHIHEGYGHRKIGADFYNAAILDALYRVRNSPIEVELATQEHNLPDRSRVRA